jgi:hypothetical protein
MVVRLLLVFLFMSSNLQDLIAGDVDNITPEYCAIYNDLFDYDYQAKLEDEIEKSDQAGFDTCVGGQKQIFKYEDLLNYTRAIQKEIVDDGSKEFRVSLKNELVRESFRLMQSYTFIPGVKIDKKSIKKLKSCLGQEADSSEDKDDFKFSYETFVSNSFKDSIQVKAYLDQLKEFEHNFEPFKVEYRRYDTLARHSKRSNKHKNRSKGINQKIKSYRDPAIDATYAKIKKEYDNQRNKIIGKVYQIASTNPTLFKIGRDWSFEKDIELSDMGNTYIDNIPKKVQAAMRNLNSDNINAIYKNYESDIQGHVSALINNKSLKENTQNELNSFVEEGIDDVVDLCHGDGERLHHFPLLVEKVMTDKGSNSDITENDIMSLQASYCHLLNEEPLNQKGFMSEKATNFGLGASLLGTGLLFSPFAPFGALILGGTTTAFVADTSVIAYKEQKLSEENQLAHSVGWNSLSSYIENDEAFWKTVSLEAVLAATWIKFPGVHITNMVKKGRDATRTADENMRALKEDHPGEMIDDLFESHKGKGNSELNNTKNNKIIKKLDRMRDDNKAYSYPTKYRDTGMEKRLDDISKESGKSHDDAFTDAWEEMSNLGDDFSKNQAHLADALLAQKKYELLTRVKIKNISPEKPLIIDLPVIKDGKILKNSGGKNKLTFKTQDDFDAYVTGLSSQVDKNLFKHLLSKETVSDEFTKTLDDLDEYISYRTDLTDLVNNGKLEYAQKVAIEKQVGSKIPTENNPVTVTVPYIKDGKMVYPPRGGDHDIVFRNEKGLIGRLEKKQDIIDEIYATTKAQAFNKESSLTDRMIKQAELRRKLSFVREELAHIPKAERSYKQQELYLRLLKAYDDPKLFPRTREKNILNTLELRAERKELSRRYLSRFTFKQFGRRIDDPASRIKRYTGQLTYLAAIGGLGSYAYNEVTFDIEDALKSGDIGKVRSFFSHTMDIKRRTLFGASDEELTCASQIRGFVFDNMCLLPLLEKYLIVEYTKRKNNPSFDMATDKVAIRKTIDYMKYMLDLRNLRGDGAVSQLHDKYRFRATSLSGANILVKALDLVDGVTKEEVSIAYRIVTTTNKKKKEELIVHLSTLNPELTGAVKLALEIGIEDSLVAYGELPVEVKELLNSLITKAKESSDELALIEAKEVGRLLSTD